jgi:hypothetical protein
VRWLKVKNGVWSELHNSVECLRGLVRRVDEGCCEIEQETGSAGIEARRSELGTRTLTHLANFRPFEIADKTASDKINSLERQAERSPEQVRMYEMLVKARAELREGVKATRRALVERCEMVRGN